MSTDTNPEGDSLPVSRTSSTFPEPVEHGAAVQNVLNDLAPSREDERPGDRDTLYDRAVTYWREHVGDYEQEPHLLDADFSAEWLPDGRFALLLTTSKWKAGVNGANGYSPFYEQHLKLREVVAEGVEEDDANRGQEFVDGLLLEKPPLALHVEVMPQYRDLVYKDGNVLECPYGEGTRLVAWTTWAESGEAVETRAYDALRAAYGEDAVDVEADRNYDSRRIAKAEAHIRFALAKKNAAVETVEQSKNLIEWGGEAEIDAAQRRLQEGWLEARVSSGRWDLLGFDAPGKFKTELKIYQADRWHKKPPSDPFRHPKMEASFDGVEDGKLPHVDQWDAVLDYLKAVVATHAEWASIGRADLVEDDFFAGPAAPRWGYLKPDGRREMLHNRYKDRATAVYREALKESTTAVYDLLRVIQREGGATYDHLVRETGLARSTVRYHVARLAEEGVLKRLGNPVLVVFVSRDLLERAGDVLQEARPGDSAEDLEERADERRQRREEQRDSDEHDDAEGLDADDDGASWAFLRDAPIGADGLLQRLYDERLGECDVRVRVSSLNAPPG
ncbi:winged helix-turn-helix domain-containing protein [Haloplanus aerogenes]|uniref:Winged helix-turn-helix DNA-binding protein n=1 Tax=Haloplanus aerogenes TaxID=660522 RepID=A0A3M0CHL4_9EURY|nr:winged helix-turn-helix domain-containing protein [Haloplanus aerogenes]AZH26830.1 winged helix-turn-helix domain-containing protein [Haloplanus aerogenes]RMB09078.1 winged helix-turn-helix DNA-binding protein [Haloplanus aerogenes]